MCNICGCQDHLDQEHDHQHSHQEHNHNHPEKTTLINLEENLLSKNNAYGAQNREIFKAKNILCLNLISSPGSGKTTLLVETLKRLKDQVPLAVIEGDQQTSLDADKIKAVGIESKQINTGKACHLDAHAILHAVEEITPPENGILFIENVGNLVCPTDFDLGEAAKVVILSVTEGEDKPLKYPHIFLASSLMIITKIDLINYVDFNLEKCQEYAKRINPKIQILLVSAKTGQGMEDWINWLKSKIKIGN